MRLLGTHWRTHCHRPHAEPSASGTALRPLLRGDADGNSEHEAATDARSDVPYGDSHPGSQREADSDPKPEQL
jgi:hypothetical protein